MAGSVRFLTLSLTAVVLTGVLTIAATEDIAASSNQGESLESSVVDAGITGEEFIYPQADAAPGAAAAGPAGANGNATGGGKVKGKPHANATNYQMKAADHSLARPEYLAIIGGIGALLFGGAAFG